MVSDSVEECKAKGKPPAGQTCWPNRLAKLPVCWPNRLPRPSAGPHIAWADPATGRHELGTSLVTPCGPTALGATTNNRQGTFLS